MQIRKQLKLWEFHCNHNQLGEQATRDLSILFSEMDTLEKVDISANNSKYGLRMVLKSLFTSKLTLRDLDISCNKTVNKSIRPLEKLIKCCPKLERLAISDLNMKQQHIITISEAIVAKIKLPQSRLQEIEWSYDMEICGKQGLKFIDQRSTIKNSNVKKLKVNGVFQNRSTRNEIREKIAAS
jgi:hypothetical protein